jgi:hypothetical protein
MDEKCFSQCIIHRCLIQMSGDGATGVQHIEDGVGSSTVVETVRGDDRTVHPNNQREM